MPYQDSIALMTVDRWGTMPARSRWPVGGPPRTRARRLCLSDFAKPDKVAW